MNLRPTRKADDISPNITPLIDVVFLLLIFFMVSTSFERNAEINIVLPEASEENLTARADIIHVIITAEGEIHINKERVVHRNLDGIQDALNVAALGIEKPQVKISADADASHQSVIQVMDAARNAGLLRITWAVKQIAEAPPGAAVETGAASSGT